MTARISFIAGIGVPPVKLDGQVEDKKRGKSIVSHLIQTSILKLAFLTIF
jgi:hypothetical protein